MLQSEMQPLDVAVSSPKSLNITNTTFKNTKPQLTLRFNSEAENWKVSFPNVLPAWQCHIQPVELQHPTAVEFYPQRMMRPELSIGPNSCRFKVTPLNQLNFDAVVEAPREIDSVITLRFKRGRSWGETSSHWRTHCAHSKLSSSLLQEKLTT